MLNFLQLATVGKQWANSGPAVGKQWVGSGQTVGKQWVGSGQTVGKQWANSGPAVDRQWAGSGPAVGLGHSVFCLPTTSRAVLCDSMNGNKQRCL